LGTLPTLRVALAAAVLSAIGVLRAPVESTKTPVTALVTVTLKVHVVPDGVVELLTVILSSPGAKLPVAEQPAPDMVAFGSGAFTMGNGYVSTNVAP